MIFRVFLQFPVSVISDNTNRQNYLCIDRILLTSLNQHLTGNCKNSPNYNL